jgi:hypothetical protein
VEPGCFSRLKGTSNVGTKLLALVVGGGHLVEWCRYEILTHVRNDATKSSRIF